MQTPDITRCYAVSRSSRPRHRGRDGSTARRMTRRSVTRPRRTYSTVPLAIRGTRTGTDARGPQHTHGASVTVCNARLWIPHIPGFVWPHVFHSDRLPHRPRRTFCACMRLACCDRAHAPSVPPIVSGSPRLASSTHDPPTHRGSSHTDDPTPLPNLPCADSGGTASRTSHDPHLCAVFDHGAAHGPHDMGPQNGADLPVHDPRSTCMVVSTPPTHDGCAAADGSQNL